MLEGTHEYPTKAELATINVNVRKQKKQDVRHMVICVQTWSTPKCHLQGLNQQHTFLRLKKSKLNKPVRGTNKLNRNVCSSTTHPQSNFLPD